MVASPITGAGARDFHGLVNIADLQRFLSPVV